MSNYSQKKSPSTTQHHSKNGTQEKLRWPIFIPNRYIKKAKHKNGAWFFIISFVNNGIAKQTYVPFSWLRQDASGKGYYGYIEINMLLGGVELVKTKVNTSEWLKFFPPQKMKGRRNYAQAK